LNGSSRTALILTLAAGIGLAAARAEAWAQPPANPTTPPNSLPKSLAIRESRTGPQRPGARPGPALPALVADAATPKPPVRVVTAPAPEIAAPPAPRFRIRDESGRCVVARLHDQYGGKTALIRPDGQLGFPSMLVPTDEPFVPLTAEAL